MPGRRAISIRSLAGNHSSAILQGVSWQTNWHDETSLPGETNSSIARAPHLDYCDKAAVCFTNAAGGALDDASSESEFRFTVSYSDQELRTYGKAMAGRYARAQAVATAFGILFAAILILGLAVFGAIKFGLVAPSAVRPVLLTAYFSFTTGVAGYYFVMRGYFGKLIRTDQRGGTWNYSFAPAGIFYNSEFIEVRLEWRAVHAVEDLGKMVIFRFWRPGNCNTLTRVLKRCRTSGLPRSSLRANQDGGRRSLSVTQRAI